MNAIRSKHLSVLVAILIAAALTVTACGGSTEAQGKYGTLSNGQLLTAFRADDKPTSFIQDGKPAGFLIDLMTSVAQKLNLTPKFVATDFASILPGVQNHRYDTAAFGTQVTPERKRATNFTTATSYGQAQLVCRKSAPLANVQAAGGKSIAITRGSSLIPLLQKAVPTVAIRQFPNIAASVNALSAGQVDGMFTGQATVASLLAQHSDFTASQAITSGMTAFPVAKDRTALLAGMNSALGTIMKDGSYTKIFDKWFPSSMRIPDQLLHDYPGMPQRGNGS